MQRIFSRGFGRGLGRFFQQPLRQRFEAHLASDRRAGSALRPQRQVDVLEAGHILGRADPVGQLLCQQFPFLQRLEDRFASFLQFLEALQTISDRQDGHFVQAAGRFLAVAADERNGRAVGQQTGGRLDAGQGDFEQGSDGGSGILRAGKDDVHGYSWSRHGNRIRLQGSSEARRWTDAKGNATGNRSDRGRVSPRACCPRPGAGRAPPSCAAGRCAGDAPTP